MTRWRGDSWVVTTIIAYYTVFGLVVRQSQPLRLETLPNNYSESRGRLLLQYYC